MSKIDKFSELVKTLQENNKARTLALFHDVADRVPAYGKFLKDNAVDAGSVKTYDDFSKLPTINKTNYLRNYPLNELCWDGNLFGNNIISSSSGSSGSPFFWPRGEKQHLEAEQLYEKIYSQTHNIGNESTLLVVCFSMGTWIAGVYTTLGAFGASRSNKLNIVTPGIEKEDAITAIQGLNSQYDQIILAGYPPFVKDLIDFGKEVGVDWSSIKTKFSFAGESITEEWRDHLISLVGADISPLETVNLYGTADMGVVGFETPLSVFIRRRINDDKQRFGSILVDGQLPTIIQYDLSQRHIEQRDGNLIITADYGIPLIRYDIGDRGGIITINESCSALGLGDDSFPSLNGTSIIESLTPSDFIYLKRREDFSVSFYSLLVYPEHIKAALEDARIRGYVSGKFNMKTTVGKDHKQMLDVHIEVRPGCEATHDMATRVGVVVVETLIRVNSEYRKLRNSIGDSVSSPNIYLYEFGSSELFDIKNKQKWT